MIEKRTEEFNERKVQILHDQRKRDWATLNCGSRTSDDLVDSKSSLDEPRLVL